MVVPKLYRRTPDIKGVMENTYTAPKREADSATEHVPSTVQTVQYN